MISENRASINSVIPVWALISEAHRIPSSDGSEMIPVETVFSEAGLKNPVAELFAEELRRALGEVQSGWDT